MTSKHVRVVEENVAIAQENARLAQENKLLRMHSAAPGRAHDAMWNTSGNPNLWSAPPGLGLDSFEPACANYFDAPAGSMLKAAARAQWAPGETQVQKEKGGKVYSMFKGRVPATTSLDSCKYVWASDSKSNSFASTEEPSTTTSSFGTDSSFPSIDTVSMPSGSGAKAETMEQKPPPPKLALPSHPETTVMMRNLPKQCSRDTLLAVIDSEGFVGAYDFIYLPIDFVSSESFGYCFINFVNHEEAGRFREYFQNFSQWTGTCEKRCDVAWSDNIHQGLTSHIDRYRSSPVMHVDMPDECKPAVFANGERATFPPPLKRIRAPRIRPR